MNYSFLIREIFIDFLVVFMDMVNNKTAGIIIIGNEILSGKVRDTNSFFLTTELRALGVEVRRISVIPDEVDIIGREAVEFSNSYDYVFTTGGVGPTHDDITMEGIAKGFGVKLIRHPQVEDFLKGKYRSVLNSATLKLAEIPEGAEVIAQENMRFPLVIFKNIFIFPGIPDYLKNKFSLIKERLRAAPFYLKRVFLNAHELDFTDILNAVVEENPDVSFGSYPIIGNPEYRVIITIESKSETTLDKAFNELINRLPADILVRVE